MTDTFKTLADASFGEYKEKGSKFLAYAYPLSISSDDESDFTVFLEKTKKEHAKARHYCYAWRLGTDGNRFRANDDGEPSGTAGRPILGQIDSFGLTNVGVVVVRYFGGTLLGTSGLIVAYRESTAAALTNATVVEKIIEEAFQIRFTYDRMPDVMNALKRLEINVLHQDFDADSGTINFAIRKSEALDKMLKLRAFACKISIEEAAFHLKNKPEWFDLNGIFI